MTRPIDNLVAVPVPGKPFTFILRDKVTGEPFDVAARIQQAFVTGQVRKSK